jgi:hypothetical protein
MKLEPGINVILHHISKPDEDDTTSENNSNPINNTVDRNINNNLSKKE